MIDPSTFRTMAAEIGAEVPAEGAERLLAYLDAMLEENRNVNLTAVRDPEAAVVFHALDSVAIACVEFDRPPREVLDLGTGNGFPGVAVACLLPDAHVLLMDRTLKKLKAIERALGRAGFEAGRFDTVQMDAAEAPGRGYRGK
ncbi:MAG TPA: hypothetical protein ENJ09_13230, partial [Planctomycetes bacterium]|nr:hypothetical protein [Planctomycetota bacterium]